MKLLLLFLGVGGARGNSTGVSYEEVQNQMAGGVAQKPGIANYNGEKDQTIYTGGAPTPFRQNGTSTNRTGNNSDPGLPAPDPITKIPYYDGLYDGIGANYSNDHVVADTEVLGTESSTGSACSSKGFLCDFKNVTWFGAYHPLDFVWKVVDPLDFNIDPIYMRTLPCEVIISASGQNSNQTRPHFYVPLGQANTANDNYCDIEAVRRVINDKKAVGEMSDIIRVRAETGRLNNKESSEFDIIGEQYDLVCSCTVTLDVDVSVTILQDTRALLTTMQSTGQKRGLSVELRLYNDSLLTNEITSNMPYPTGSPNFYFLTRHLSDEDWDTQLQLNKCVACSNAAAFCNTTDSTNNDAVVFYDQCEVLLGGPQFRPISNASWYYDATVTPPSNYKPYGIWSDSDPTRCPYHAIGVQKFRLSSTNTMTIVCAVTACTARPCAPCVTADTGSSSGSSSNLPRRLLSSGYKRLARRRLQGLAEFTSHDIGIAINFFANDDAEAIKSNSDDDDAKTDNDASSSSSKKAKVQPFLLAIILLIVAFTMYICREKLKKAEKAKQNKQVHRSAEPSVDENASVQGSNSR